MSKKKGKSILMQNVEFYALLVLVGIMRLIPLKLAFKFSTLLAYIVYFIDSHHRRRTIQHLMHAGLADDIKSARKIAKKSFVHFGKIGVEIVKIDQYLTPDNFHEHFKWRLPEETMAALKDPAGVIFVGAHYGNWEISGLGCSVLVRPLLSVMRSFDNKKIGNYILAKRERYNQRVCAKQEAMKLLLKELRSGGAVGIIADQHASTAEGVETTFFGHPARTHFSPALLQLKTGASLIVGVARRSGDNFEYEFEAKGPFKLENLTGDKMKNLQILTQQFTTALEEIIRVCPEQWLWCHRRWLDINRKRKKV